jgi:predicted ATPase
MTVPPSLDRPSPMWKVPIALTPLLGRGQEVTTLCDLLVRPDMRLLTLVGPGGIGKTRLAMQVAAEERTHFAHGVCFVSLAPIIDPELVLPTIAQELDCRGPSAVSVGEQVKQFLHGKNCLLILDNFEHVISAAPLVEELLLTCPGLTIVVTSRTVLHVPGEQEFLVLPLALPHLNQVAESSALSEYAAINLFLQRVRAVKPAFEITAANARAIAKICIQLDGLPLAIELAAARMKVLPSQELLARLSQRFLVLTSGPRTAPARQQTLRNTLQWSYDLLTEEEQAFFRLLAVFAGGCSFDAAEAVYHSIQKRRGRESEERDTLTLITSLIDQSLLQQSAHEGEEPRLVLLETIREYGRECLQVCGELDQAQRAHAEYYLAFAEQGECHLCPPSVKDGGQQLLWLARFNREQENVRAAIQWFAQHQEAELLLRCCLAVSGYFYWSVGNWDELTSWYEAALALSSKGKQDALYAEALGWFGYLHYEVGRTKGKTASSALALLEEAVALLREAGKGERRRLISILTFLGMVYQHLCHDDTKARALFEEALVLGRELGDKWRMCMPLISLGNLLEDQGDLGGARAAMEECLVICDQIDERWGRSTVCAQLASIAVAQEDHRTARLLALEAIDLAGATGARLIMIAASCWLGNLAIRQNETGEALKWYTQALALAREMNYHTYIPFILNNLGTVALLEGETTRAMLFVQEALDVAQKTGEQRSKGQSFAVLGAIAFQQEDDAQAQAHFQKGLFLAKASGYSHTVGYCLLGLARLANKAGQCWQAVRLLSKAEQC